MGSRRCLNTFLHDSWFKADLGSYQRHHDGPCIECFTAVSDCAGAFHIEACVGCGLGVHAGCVPDGDLWVCYDCYFGSD